MLVLYIRDGEMPRTMQLGALFKRFDKLDNGWVYYQSRENIRDELDSRGWCEGEHETGKYLILDLKKLGLTASSPDIPSWQEA